MERNCTRRSFVTEYRMEAAVRHADALAAEDPSLAAHDCAAAAVRRVFGRWIAQPDGAVRIECLPLYFQLCNRVESRLGLHREARFAGRGPFRRRAGVCRSFQPPGRMHSSVQARSRSEAALRGGERREGASDGRTGPFRPQALTNRQEAE